MGKVYLVGAGPGDPDLISVKGLKSLEKADVVLYDALVNKELLQHCQDHCELVYVGKKPGIHAFQQVLINDMLVAYARKFDHVVRLKGGDPFVFGRGHEELEHAQSHGIEVEVIPGISSSAAVPALSHIPLTKRGINESFWVVTGTILSEGISSDIELAAKSSATVVVLMGMKNLAKIVTLFAASRGIEEPIAIIQNGSTKKEKKIFGTLNEIEYLVEKQELGSPAIIIIGEVVRESREFNFSAHIESELQRCY